MNLCKNQEFNKIRINPSLKENTIVLGYSLKDDISTLE